MIRAVPLHKRKPVEYLRHTLPTRNEQSVSDGEGRLPRNLGNDDITKLLDDLDNQTDAIKSGQQIGEELLEDKNETGGSSLTNSRGERNGQLNFFPPYFFRYFSPSSLSFSGVSPSSRIFHLSP